MAEARTGFCVDQLNGALHQALERDPRVYLLGEDIVDPYGGAFKVTRGLSSRFPDRVLATPISEAALVGVATGMALRGLRPVAEIMFGDFITLAFDQIVNHLSKFASMYDGQVSTPLVVRTPMGGRRGYGPTHSQSLEKLLCAVPNIRVVAASEFHDSGALLRAAIEDERPVFFIENKLVYGRRPRRPKGGSLGPFLCSEGKQTYPSLVLRAGADCRATIVAWGGMCSLAVEAATRLALDRELLCEVVLLSSLQPLEIETVIDSARRTGALVTTEEGTRNCGIGAEIAARVHECAGSALRHAVRRVAADDDAIPAAPRLEQQVLPQVEDIAGAVLAVAGGPDR